MGKKYDLVIFDCDGVIFESKEANRVYYNRVLKEVGLPPMTGEELEYVHMHPAEESIRYLLRREPSLLQKAQRVVSRLDYTDFIPFMVMEPGVEDAMETLKPHVRIAMSTNRSTTMERLKKLFRLERWFDLIVCALDVSRPKPDPEGVEYILKNLSVDRERAVYVGDSTVDEETADRSGLDLIAYKNPALNARYHVTDFGSIPPIILSP